MAAVLSVALLALGGAATASAEGRPGGDGGRGDGRGRAMKCDRLAEKIAKLERVIEKLTAFEARIEEKIASGELTGEQLARARAFLAKLQKRIAKLEEMLARLEQKQAEKCADDSGESPLSTTSST